MPDPTDERFQLDDDRVRGLAQRYGTPLYVVDEAHFRARIRRYRQAFADAYPQTELVYASKANGTLALLAIAHQEGCAIDVASEGELRGAIAAGVPPEHCRLHGNNKSVEELRFAMARGVGQIVVDCFPEIDRIFELTQGRPPDGNGDSDRLRCPDLLLRLAPGVDPVTHQKISTGQADTKFGFNIANGAAHRAVCILQGLGLPVAGYHCHVGSQLLDPDAQRAGGELIARFAADMLYRRNMRPKVLNVGGGLGVRYLDDDSPVPIEEYCRLIVDAVRPVLEEVGIRPTLAQEPGRSLIAESGVTLYTVGVVKSVPSPSRGLRTYIAVDGGLADNPRPALYNARYKLLHTPGARTGEGGGVPEGEASASLRGSIDAAGDPLDTRSNYATVAGRHCETDLLFEDVELPSELVEGDLLQVLCTGAYNSSMASNYNRYPRPATVLIRPDGSEFVAQERETWDALFARERVPGDLQA